MPAIEARLAMTMMSATMIAQPPTQPAPGPNARVTHEKVVPASGSAALKYRYAYATSSIGMNATMKTAGACSPATATTNPRVAASEYPGATDATEMTRFE